jgi:limonene-1,2-epoxide hydrolase
MSEATRIVEDFIQIAWAERDVEKIMSFFTPDCCYHNIPMEPLEGADAIRGFLEGFVARSSEIEWEIHQIADTGAGVVLTERSDKFKVGDKWIVVPVMGVMEIRDGKIAAWRDYFDLAQYRDQMSG